MHILKSLLTAGVLLASLSSVHGADKSLTFAKPDLAAASTLRERGLSDDTAWRLVESLTTEVGPRAAGSPGDAAAVAWAMREMQRLGFANVHTMDVTVPHWVRGDAQFAVVSPWPQPMPVLALGGSVGTGAEGIEAEAVMVRDVAALNALPAGAVKDRIVFFTNRMERTQDGSGYGKAVAVRATGPAVAGSLGALGVVIRSVSTSDVRFPHTGATRYRDDAPRIPAFAISNPDADALERQFASGKPVRLRLWSTSRELPAARSANVIGEIPGSDRAAEIVLLGAHLDSWDIGTGATDNASGSIAVLEAARLLGALKSSGIRPRRTIRFALFSGEEQGLFGSQYYVMRHAQEMPVHQAVLVLDNGTGRITGLPLQGRDELHDLWNTMLKPLAALGPFAVRSGSKGGTDHLPFLEARVPAFNYDQLSRGYDYTHHSQIDVLAHAVHADVRQSAIVMAANALQLANLDRRIRRDATP